jgi:sensor histidine kinase regulating citrate/malate metabolism
MYEDNAGGMSSDQISYFNQKEFGPYRGAEKKGYGLFLIKKLVEHQGGKFLVRKTSNGTRFEISY